MSISERIQTFMDERGWTQNDLVEEILVNEDLYEDEKGRIQAHVSRWQRGIHRPNPEGLLMLAHAFEISVEDLLDD